MRLGAQTPSGADDGFTFVEVLIALVILAIAAVTLLSAESAALEAERRAQLMEQQRLLAEQVLTAVRSGSEGELKDLASDPRWTVSFTGLPGAGWTRLSVAPRGQPGPALAWHIRLAGP